MGDNGVSVFQCYTMLRAYIYVCMHIKCMVFLVVVSFLRIRESGNFSYANELCRQLEILFDFGYIKVHLCCSMCAM